MSLVVRKARRVLLLSALFLVAFRLAATSFNISNTNLIAISDSPSPPTKANPYPSSITVTGFAGQVVSKVTLTLHGFTHSFPSDVDVLLVGPQGQAAIMMSSVGGQNKFSVTNLMLTFDDDAVNPLPVLTTLTSGTFKPTNGYLALGYSNFPFDFPLPAPTGNSNSVAALSVFKNSDPDGVWQLFVVDDVGGDAGSISNGWSLNLSISVPLQITRALTNVIVSWPGSATNYSLQTTSLPLASNAWKDVTNLPVLNFSRFVVTNPIVSGTRFYRLLQ